MRKWRIRARGGDGDDRAAAEWMRRGAELLGTDLDGAEHCYLMAVELDDSLSVAWFDLGLIAKWRHRWADCLEFNRRAASLAPPGEPPGNPAYWNAGIAATALRDWTMARWAWRAFGIPISDGDGPIEESFGMGVVRLPEGETVWGRRLDPARMQLLSIPFPEGGFRSDDVVLHDGEPVGSRVTEGREYSVFNVIEQWHGSSVPTISVEVEASEIALDELLRLSAAEEMRVENWTESVSIHCLACSTGRVDYDDPAHDHRPVRTPGAPIRLGFSADESEVRGMLASWESATGGTVLDLVVHR
ncbi:MAG: tetratricopeptide repeat protein [Actinomycetota bacterium]|nr:tetratricopeptide repeat protein [Actinomycetota bacterium]